MLMKIIKDDCLACGTCKEVCPNAAIEFVNGEYTINPETCIGCAICAEYCPVEAISEVE